MVQAGLVLHGARYRVTGQVTGQAHLGKHGQTRPDQLRECQTEKILVMILNLNWSPGFLEVLPEVVCAAQAGVDAGPVT